MNGLSELRAKMIRFYNGADVYILPILKFILAFLLFFGINRSYGYLEILNNIFIVVVLAAVCALLPLNGTVTIGMVLIVLHCFGLGTEIGLLAFCFYLLLFILIIRFVPKDSLAILLTPFAFQLSVPAAIPVALGMLGRASSALTGACALISYFFLDGLTEIAAVKEEGELSSLEILQKAMDSIVNNDKLILLVIVFIAVILVVYLVRKMVTSYSWLASIIAGTAVYILLMLCGGLFLEIELDLTAQLIGSAISAVICLIIAFFKFNADYKGSRYIQFEDDDYYYYVKAIPKVKVKTVPEEEYEELDQ